MWQTCINICPSNQFTTRIVQDTIRYEMSKISDLHKNGEVNWYYFTIKGDNQNLYFDIRFTTDKNNPNEFLPKSCINTRKIPPDRKISDVEIALLLNEDATEGWRIVGDQSEFVIRLVRAHKEEIEIPNDQIMQFIHFFMNPLGLGQQSVFFNGNIETVCQVLAQCFPKDAKKWKRF